MSPAPGPERMSTNWPASAFWGFSLGLYGRPGVEAACLTLQDEHGLDVNLVLLAAWTACTGRRLAPPLARRLRVVGDDHQARIMQPMRQVRRALKDQDLDAVLAPIAAERRRALLALELDLERLEQLQLEQIAAAAEAAPGLAAASLFSANLGALYPERPLPAAILSQLTAEFPHVVGGELPGGQLL